ncbi:MAG TPA: dinitrogenase iron-molybdenum cofactor biosynthesis protein [Firmicutes bacterium]|nr:dinitrogenase iron-molybdenum cofactor biosynthesis protein [Bacillota bacterium]
MKVAVAAQGREMNSEIDPRFGRCPYFVLVDTETMQHEWFANPGVTASGGAGMQTVQTLVKKGVSAVIVNNVGPNAIEGLKAAGIGVYSAVKGTVREAVEAFREGKLAPIEGATVFQHFGVGRS